jgi:hypothetical protein
MATPELYKNGIYISDTTPTGSAGQMIQNNFKTIADNFITLNGGTFTGAITATNGISAQLIQNGTNNGSVYLDGNFYGYGSNSYIYGKNGTYLGTYTNVPGGDGIIRMSIEPTQIGTYIPLNAGTNKITSSYIPSTDADLVNKLYLEGSLPVTVTKNGDSILIRTSWNTGNDLLQEMSLNSLVYDWGNNCVNFKNMGLIPSSTGKYSSATNLMSPILKSTTDDACPFNINGTFIGGNHGPDVVVLITATGHGLGVSDIGSKWTDGTTNFYIVKIFEGDSLIFVLSENNPTGNIWNFTNVIDGASLTRVGASGTLSFSAQTKYQLTPIEKHLSKKVYLDGKTEISTNGTWACNYVDIVHNYEIMDPSSILTYIKSGTPWASIPSFVDASNSLASVSLIYRFTENGSCTIFQTVNLKKEVKMDNVATGGYFGFMQSEPITIPSSGTMCQYVPKSATSGQSYGTNSISLTNVQDISWLFNSNTYTLALRTADFADSNNPPDRFLQIAKSSSGTNYFGFMLGYNPKIGIGKAAERKTFVDTAWYMPGTFKSYPVGVGGTSSTRYATNANIIPANTSFECVSFRTPVNYSTYSTFTNVSWYYVGSDVYLMIDNHANFSGYVPLKYEFTGKQIEVVEKHDNVTVNSLYVTQDGINITITGNYGYLVARLY